MRISDWSSDVCSSDLYILLPHRRADADMCGFMAEARGVGAELAGALQGHRFAVEGTHQQHLLVQIDQILAVLGELGHVLAHRLAVGRSEERRVGKECVSTCRSRWSRYR